MASFSPSDTGIVLLVGSGGRESAIAWKLSQSPSVRRVLLVPGNDYIGLGYAEKIENASFSLSLDDATNFGGLSKWCRDAAVSLVVVGPEAPLAAGLADYLNQQGIPCFGPTKNAARLEWDKAFAKNFFDKQGIPTAKWKAFSDSKEAVQFIKRYDSSFVILLKRNFDHTK
jgi:phosphoribosylamine--glycine ligase / phosphoribosylglycinamide formyltransferase / phosphoribosylformylglycinamidine cyclo-ligase